MAATASYPSLIEINANENQDWWAAEGSTIRAVLRECYGTECSGAVLTPSSDPGGLRARLRAAAPMLAELTDRVREAFDAQHACTVLVPHLGLREVDVDTKRIGVFAFASLIGNPSANIPFAEVFWDVRNNGDSATRHSSFSENDREAVYHTDNGALQVPERFFLLYAVRAANCGGGVSMIRDARILVRELQKTPQGRDAVQVLIDSPIPRRIPKAFRDYAHGLVNGYQHVPVFAGTPLVRWRTDKIYDGLAKRPEFATPAVTKAVDMLNDLLQNTPAEIHQTVPTDGVIIINNHIALHGRTAFTDPQRHLLRLRFHQPSD
jgi:hypothetical protein